MTRKPLCGTCRCTSAACRTSFMTSKFNRSSSRCSSPVSRHRWLQRTFTCYTGALNETSSFTRFQAHRASGARLTGCGGSLRHSKVRIGSGFGAHSSPYDCRSPSGKTPLENRSATGTVGGLVCSNTFFLPAVHGSSVVQRERPSRGLCKVSQASCLCWPSSWQCPRPQEQQQRPHQHARFLRPPHGHSRCLPARRQAARPHRLHAGSCQRIDLRRVCELSAQGVC